MSALSRSFLICKIIISSWAQKIKLVFNNSTDDKNFCVLHLHLADGLVLQLNAALQLRDLSARLIEQVLVMLEWISS